MEKISYEPLVEHLKKCANEYDAYYLQHELKYGAIDSRLIAGWMVNVIEPIIESIKEKDEEVVAKVFKVLYVELLKILGSKAAITYEADYIKSWCLCLRIPKILVLSPSRILKAINSAVLSIRTYQPEKVTEWIDRMHNSIDKCESIDDFLNAGRINAWICGMAHLRESCKEIISSLSSGLADSITKQSAELNMLTVASQKWPNLKKARFVGEIGGFAGLDGPFLQPPVVAKFGNDVLATDKRISCAFYADSFGKVLVPEIPVSAQEIYDLSTNDYLDSFYNDHGKDVLPYEDITSWVISDSTLIVTRRSSHYLYVYGWA